MATRNETHEDPDSCWNRANDEEQVFVLLGRDRHAPALIRLWAEMREKEGEDAAIVNEAREVAQMMEDDAVANSRVVLSLSAVSTFAASLKAAPTLTLVTTEEESPEAPVDPYNLRVGEVVVAGHGRPAKLVKVFGTDNQTDPQVRGMANIQLPRSLPVTVEFGMLRRALPEEVEEYRNSGGRI